MVRVAACARRSGRSLLGHARQAPLICPCSRCSCSSDPTAFGVSRVSMLRRFIFAPALDRGERHTRSAAWGLHSGPPSPGRPLPLMTRAPTSPYWKPHPKICRTRNPEGPTASSRLVRNLTPQARARSGCRSSGSCFAQAVRCRRRHQPRKPPLAKLHPVLKGVGYV